MEGNYFRLTAFKLGTNHPLQRVVVDKGTKRIKEVRTMREVREFIENEMYYELPLWEIANYGK